MKPLLYAETLPSPELSAFVHSFWFFEVSPEAPLPLVHHVWPDGCVSAVFGARFFAVVGPTTSARRVPISEPGSIRGVRFRPEAGAAVVGMASETLRDHRFELALPESLERWLNARVAAAPQIDALVRDAVEAIVAARGELGVEALAGNLGVSMRQLQRRFRRAVGLTPKEFARIRRFRSAVGAVLDGTDEWARVAAEFGFADQAHLSREFLEIAGFSPVAFERRLAEIAHRDVKP